MQKTGYIITNTDTVNMGDRIYTNIKDAINALTVTEYNSGYRICKVNIDSNQSINLSEINADTTLSDHELEVLKNNGCVFIYDDTNLNYDSYIVVNNKYIRITERS